MRILHVTPYYAPAWAWGGVVAAVTGLSRAQVRAGHQVSVLTTDTLGPGRRGPAGVAALDGVEVWRARTRGAAMRARLNLSWPVGFAAAARRLIERGGCEVVHCHELRTVETLIAARVADRAAVAVVLSPHGTLPYATGRVTLKKIWDALLARRMLPRFRHVVALTPREAEETRGLWAAHGLRLERGRVSIVPNGVDPGEPVGESERRAARRRLGLGDDDRVVLFMGRLHRRKRLGLLVEAFAELARRCPQARLIIAGPDDGDLAGVQGAVARHDLTARVLVTGMVSDGAQRDVLAAADVFALVGSGEGMPMAALEALAAGVPVVLAEANGLAEVVPAGAGFIVGHDPAAIAAALEQVVLAPDRGSAMRQGAHGLAASRFAWPAIVEPLDGILRAAISPASTARSRG